MSELRGIADSQRSALYSAVENHEAQVDIIETEIEIAQFEMEGLQQQLEKSQQELQIIARQDAEYQSAYKAGAVSRRERDTIRREHIDLETRMIKIRNGVNVAKTRIAREKARMQELKSEFELESLDRIAALEAEKAQIVALIEQHTDRVKRLEIRSPVDGLVNHVSVKGPRRGYCPRPGHRRHRAGRSGRIRRG